MFDFLRRKKSKKGILKDALANRIEEVQSYQINIDNYTRMIEKLPKEWPAQLIMFRNSDVNALAHAAIDTEQRNLASDLLFKDQLEILLINEKLQQRRSLLVLTVLEEQLK